jgi:hypothetical protein
MTKFLVLFFFSIASGYILAKDSTVNLKDYSQTLKAIGQDITGLKNDFPQLTDFSEKNLNLQRLSIAYQYHTHAPQRSGGWTSGVPNPDDDGVWFYIDIHDPNSNLQIHTQPVTAALCLKEMRVSFLILEGSKTKSLYGPIHAILKKHGAEVCK